jgi:negative regulator of sigma E activity
MKILKFKSRALTMAVRCAVVAAAVLAVALGVFEIGQQERAPSENAPADPVKTAQSTSSKCSTSAGICYVSPLPIGSACRCGNTSGTIIP